MQYIIVCFISLFLHSPALADTLQGKVVKVADGDTVTIIDDSGKKHRIRFAGIDAPEKDQPFGDVSTENLVKLVSGKTVTIEHEKRDRYKRIVGKALVDPPGDVFCMALDCVKKIDAGLEQIKAGLAWHYKYYQKEQSEEDRRLYSKAESEARIKQIGLWKDEEPIAPWEWRRK
ncbi:MAG: thermonuclease family protein [Nitrospinaceae bacterium]|nr:thermonuclease family protein [Nitrospinaceae bacterium]